MELRCRCFYAINRRRMLVCYDLMTALRFIPEVSNQHFSRVRVDASSVVLERCWRSIFSRSMILTYICSWTGLKWQWTSLDCLVMENLTKLVIVDGILKVLRTVISKLLYRVRYSIHMINSCIDWTHSHHRLSVLEVLSPPPTSPPKCSVDPWRVNWLI